MVAAADSHQKSTPRNQWSETKVGTPQGAVVSPLLANVYLHYVFDLWVEAWRKKVARGDVIVVRYADDLVVGFQHRTDAERFLQEFGERLAKFGLELHADKTRLIEFGRFAAHNRKQRGEGKPETFTFLGFTHFCGQTTRTRAFTVWRITAKKRMVAKLKAIKAELQCRKHDPTRETGAWLRTVVLGYYQYHAVPGNSTQLRIFWRRACRLWRKRFSSPQSTRPGALGTFVPHLVPMDSPTPCSASLSSCPLRRHPSSVRAVCVNALARICAGGDQQLSSLPRHLGELAQSAGLPRPRQVLLLAGNKCCCESVLPMAKPRFGQSRPRILCCSLKEC
jgi:hypothetical protein